MKKVLVGLGILFGVAAVAVMALLLLIDVDAHKPRVEAAASEALGMEFRIHGRAALRLFPSVGISFADVRVRNRKTDLANVGALRVGVKLLPLLHRKVEVTELLLEKPEVFIEKGRDGKFNYETAPKPPRPASPEREGAAPVLSVRGSAVKTGRLRYVDRTSGSRVDVDGIDLSVRGLSLGGAPGDGLLKTLSFSGEVRIKEVKAGDVPVSDVRATVEAGGGTIRVRPFAMRMFGGTGQGEIEADLSGEAAEVKVRYTLSDFRAEEAFALVSRKAMVSGPLTISPDLSFRGRSAREMKRSMRGKVSVRGENLALQGMDIDDVLSKAEETRSLQLADVGAFLLAGPLGTAAVRGYGFGGVYAAARGGESRITKVVSDWSVANGVAEARDVALATRKHRIALTGKLDIAGERFVGVTVAALDEKGCAKMRQGINGPFRNPTVDRLSFLQSAAAPLLGLFERTKKLLAGGACEPFYTGSVAHPR